MSGAETGITNIVDGVVTNSTGPFWVGADGSFNAQLVTNAGVLNVTGESIIGNAATSSNNYVVVTGSGSLWSNSSFLYVGHLGSGNRLTITNGAGVINGNGNVGVYAGANDNAVLVSGTGSVWRSGSLLLGLGGSGNRLTISDGGRVLNIYHAIVGYGSSATNNSVLITGSDSVWSNNGDIWVGRYGSSNQLTITNGASALSAGGVVGLYSSASNNSVLISGNGSVWRNSSYLSVGNESAGNRLTITNGAGAFNADGYVGYGSSASSNSVLVSGVGSVWSNSAGLYVGYYGSGNQLTLADSGAVVATNIVIGVSTTSAANLITVSDGYLYATNAARTGTLDIRRGALALNSGTVTVDRFFATNGANSVVNFNGGTLQSGGSVINNGSVFTVGNGSSAATLQLAGGSHSFADTLFINSNAWLAGTGAITGVITNAGTITIGDPLGILTGSSDLALLDSSLLMMGLAGTNTWLYDQIVLGGTLNFGGTLTLSLLDDFIPTAGNRFDLFDFTSSSGFFISTNLPSLDPLLYWDLGALYTTGEIEVDQMPLLITGLQLGAGNPVSQNILWTLENTTGQDATNIVRYWLAGSSEVFSDGISSLSGSNAITVTLTGLQDDSLYYYWVQSSNALATVSAPTNSAYWQFTTPPFLRIGSLQITNIAADRAQVLWTVENNTGQLATNIAVGVNTTENFTSSSEDVSTGSGQVGLWLYGLQASTTYDLTASTEAAGYFRLSNGVTFTTAPPFLHITSQPSVCRVTDDAIFVSWAIDNFYSQAASNTVFYSWTGNGSGSSQAIAMTDVGASRVTVAINGLPSGTSVEFALRSEIPGLGSDTNSVATLDAGNNTPFTFTTDTLPPLIGISDVGTNNVTDTSAVIHWTVSKFNPNDWASHFVVVNPDVAPTDFGTAVIAAGVEDELGDVTAAISGLTPGRTYYYYVQSSIAFDPGYYATANNGGSCYSFTTDTSIAVPDNTPIISIPPESVTNYVFDTSAAFSWAVQTTVTNIPSHFVVFSTNLTMTPANSLIVSGMQDESNDVFALLTGLPSLTTNSYFIQSGIDMAAGHYTNYPPANAPATFVTLEEGDWGNGPPGTQTAFTSTVVNVSAMVGGTGMGLAEGLMNVEPPAGDATFSWSGLGSGVTAEFPVFKKVFLGSNEFMSVLNSTNSSAAAQMAVGTAYSLTFSASTPSISEFSGCWYEAGAGIAAITNQPSWALGVYAFDTAGGLANLGFISGLGGWDVDANGGGSFSTNFLSVIPYANFRESKTNSGFDDTDFMPWLVVPTGPDGNTAEFDLPPADSRLTYKFNLEHPNIADVTPETASGTGEIKITGKQEGETSVAATVNDQPIYGPKPYLGIAVYEPEVVRVFFTFVRNGINGHSTGWTESRVPGIIKELNRIYGKQACVTFESAGSASLGSIRNLGDPSVSGAINGAQRTELLHHRKDAHINVFFVWTLFDIYHQGDAINGLAPPGSRSCFIATDGYRPAHNGKIPSSNEHTIAHEIGHVLIGEIYRQPDTWHERVPLFRLIALMYPTEGGGRERDGVKLRKFEVDAIHSTIEGWKNQ